MIPNCQPFLEMASLKCQTGVEAMLVRECLGAEMGTAKPRGLGKLGQDSGVSASFLVTLTLKNKNFTCQQAFTRKPVKNVNNVLKCSLLMNVFSWGRMSEKISNVSSLSLVCLLESTFFLSSSLISSPL